VYWHLNSINFSDPCIFLKTAARGSGNLRAHNFLTEFFLEDFFYSSLSRRFLFLKYFSLYFLIFLFIFPDFSLYFLIFLPIFILKFFLFDALNPTDFYQF
jgi:hypothetical protein